MYHRLLTSLWHVLLLVFSSWCCCATFPLHSFFQLRTRRSHLCRCPRNPWALAAATQSLCTLESRYRLLPGLAAIPSSPLLVAPEKPWARGAKAPRLARRTNLSSESSLGRKTEMPAHSPRPRSRICGCMQALEPS